MRTPFELETWVNVAPGALRAKVLGGMMAGSALLAAGPLLERSLLPPPWSFAAIGLGMGLLAGVPAYFGHLAGKYQLARVRIDDDSVRLGDHTLPRGIIRSAYFAPAAGNTRAGVRLLDASNRVLATVAAADAASSEPILEALDLGARAHTARFYALAPRGSASWFTAMAMFAAGMALIIGGSAVHPMLLVAGIVTLVAGSMLFLRSSLHIGADGALLASRIGPRFIPWSEVVRIEPSSNGITFQLQRGAFTIPLASRRRMNAYEQQLQAATLARARAALQAFQSGARPNAEARVARRGRSVADWTRDLFDRDGDFRQAPIHDDDMWRVVESPAADASARAGAAAVLARGGDQGARRRLRVAAEGCTEPKLRVVLEKAAEGVEAQDLEEALGEIGEEASKREPSRAAER